METEDLNKPSEEQQLKEEFGVESISEAAKLYRKLQGEIQVETEEIEKSIYKVEELLHDTEY